MLIYCLLCGFSISKLMLINYEFGRMLGTHFWTCIMLCWLRLIELCASNLDYLFLCIGSYVR